MIDTSQPADTTRACSATEATAMCPANSTVPAHLCSKYNFVQSLVDQFGEAVSEDGIRIASLAYGATPRLMFDGRFLSDGAAVMRGLAGFGDYDIPPPVRVASAYELLNTGVFNFRHASNDRNGYRHGAVPLIIVMLTDADSSEQGGKLDELLARDPVRTASRVVYSFVGAPAADVGQYQLLDNTRGQNQTQPRRLNCADNSRLAAEVHAMIPDLKCLTTATTTMTSSATSTPTTSATTSATASPTTTATATATTATTTGTISATSTVSASRTSTPSATRSTTATSTFTSTATSSATSTRTSTATSSASASAASTASSSPTSTGTGSRTTSATTTASSTVTTPDCQPSANLVFVLDVSSSLKNSDFNEEGAFDCLLDVMAEAIATIGNNIRDDMVHVALVVFANEAEIKIDFNDLNKFDGDRAAWLAAFMRAATYPDYAAGTETYASVHLALDRIRSNLLTRERGFEDRRRQETLVIVYLTDGFFTATTDDCYENTPAACGIDKLAMTQWDFNDEKDSEYYSHGAIHLVYRTPQHPVSDRLRAQQSANLKQQPYHADAYLPYANTTAETPILGACSAADRAVLGRFIRESADLRLCATTTATTTLSQTPTTTPFTSATATATTTQTTTPCQHLLADIIFLFDVSTSIPAGSCPDQQGCPAGATEAVCAQHDFAARVVDRLGPAVREDGVRIASAAFGDSAQMLFDGQFLADASKFLIPRAHVSWHRTHSHTPCRPNDRTRPQGGHFPRMPAIPRKTRFRGP